MDFNEIGEILSLLETTSSTHQFTGIQLKKKFAYIAIDKEGYIALILKTGEKINYQMSTDLLSLRLGNYCTITTRDKDYSGKCHVLSCRSKEKKLMKIFLMLCITLTEQINEYKNSSELLSFFSSLFQLFKTSPSSNLIKERQGLWGELFVIKQTGNPYIFVNCWHKEVTRKFDFSYKNFRLEVKATNQDERIHYFSHDQLFREDDVEIVISSLVLQDEDSGLSLKDLIEDTRVVINGNTELLLKLEKAVMSAGMNDENELGPVYDETLAKRKLSWYSSKVVPKFDQAEPEGVTSTKYKIDLSSVTKMTDDELEVWLKNWEV